MRKFVICSAFTILSFVITFGLYMTLGILTLSYLQNRWGGSSESYLGIAFIIILPVFLIIGSFFSGYFSQPYIRKPILFIFVCPGIYMAFIGIITSKGTIGGFLEGMLLCGAVWILASLAGVYLGKYIRTKRMPVI